VRRISVRLADVITAPFSTFAHTAASILMSVGQGRFFVAFISFS
jgi:hypothetical protein